MVISIHVSRRLGNEMKNDHACGLSGKNFALLICSLCIYLHCTSSELIAQIDFNGSASYYLTQEYVTRNSGGSAEVVDVATKEKTIKELKVLPLGGEVVYDSVHTNTDLRFADSGYVVSSMRYDDRTRSGVVWIDEAVVNSANGFFKQRIMYPVLIGKEYTVVEGLDGSSYEMSSDHDPDLSIDERRIVASSPSIALWRMWRYIQDNEPDMNKMSLIIEACLDQKLSGIHVRSTVADSLEQDVRRIGGWLRFKSLGSRESYLSHSDCFIDTGVSIKNHVVDRIDIRVEIVDSKSRRENPIIPGLFFSGNGLLNLRIVRQNTQ